MCSASTIVESSVEALITDPCFSRSVGMPDPRDLPTAQMRARGRAIEAAFASAYDAVGRDFEPRKSEKASSAFNWLVLLDTTTAEEDVYGSSTWLN